MAWLRAYCDPEPSTQEIADRLSLAGDEVERIDRVGVGATDAFVVGRVLEAGPHPDADRLSVCSVDDGSGEPRTIVCGAPNVAAGQTVAVARPGAVMPDGTELGEAELRGVESSGMILAEDEVGVGEDTARGASGGGHPASRGIMVLDDGIEPGTPLIEHLQVADEALELEINPNRPDCLSVYGVAREVHALTAAELADDPGEADAEPSGSDHASDHASVEIADPDVCLRYAARVFEEVKIGPSPLWLKARLAAAGQRPIYNVVDVTNYVMLLCGQPIHSFDLDRVRGARIVVRKASDGERLTTLDDVERTFDSGMALICDGEGPTGIAGVMGGQISEVSEQTTRVLMEAATWVGPNILRTSGKLGLRTEASTRFEKQLHPENALAGQRLAARLMVELCGARLVPGTIDEYPHPAEPRHVPLRLGRMERLLGETVPREETVAILGRLGFELAEDGDALTATIPYWRDGDVQREADLIEEVARIHGYDKLPTTLPNRRHAVGRLTPDQTLRRRLEDVLRDRGLSEVMSWSFTSRRTLERLRVEEPGLDVANPLSEDQSVMRPLLLGGLLDAAARNAAFGRADVGLFELARVYVRASGEAPREGSPEGTEPAMEGRRLGALLTVDAPGGWRSSRRPADLYAAKAVVEAVMAPVGLEWWTEPGGRPFLHPGRAASVFAGGHEVGWVGELHPLVACDWELGDEPVAAFELDVDALVHFAPGPAEYRDVTSFPAVLQDIAVVVDEAVPAAEVEAAVRAGAGELLASVRAFDLYRGEQVGEGNKSLALRLEFRAPDRTLTDEDVAARRAEIETALERIGGRLRG